MNMPLFSTFPELFQLSVALGLGLLIGAERERRKGEGPHRSFAGIRTFATAALLGAAAQLLAQPWLLVVSLLILGGLTLISHARGQAHDPGMTTEVALLVTCLLGALAMPAPALAGAIGISLAGLLAAKDQMHGFVRRGLSEQELQDILVFGAVILIVLPPAPDRFMGPFHAINPHDLARFVVLLMGISALGHVAKRLLGARGGMALAGFTGGFISSTATIWAMGKQARAEPGTCASATVGSMLSTLATLVQLTLLTSVMLPDVLPLMALPMGLGCGVALAYSACFSLRNTATASTRVVPLQGHVFELKATLLVTAAVATVALTGQAMNAWLGADGVIWGALATGLMDAHATVASASGMHNQNQLTASQALTVILAALSTNTLSKSIVAMVAGGASYARRLVPGLILTLSAVWLGTL